ncbi:MAG: sulfotransferase family protein [Gammaproteobacteria bacterium]|nr:MAG: sulfotransferase family protein [Gammaproteobacteria bacterium]
MKQESDNQVSLETAYKNAADLLRKREFNLAEQQLSEILKKFPDDPNALRLSGVSSLEQEKPEVALIPLQKAIRVAPEFIQAHENLAQAWTQLGDLKKAEACFKKCLEIDPSNFSNWKSLGDVLSDQRKDEEADKAYKNAISTDKKYLDLQKAMSQVQKGNLGEAERIYREILSDDPNNVDALRLLALLASRTGAVDQAINMLENCIKISPDYALAWENLAKMYRQKDDPDSLQKAALCFSKATELRPDWAEGWAGLGTMQTRSSQHEEGIESYKTSIELKDNQPRVHLSLGHVYKTTGNQEACINSYNDAISLDNNFGEAYWSLANLKTYKFSDEEISSMEKRVELTEVPEREKVHFLFSLGKAFEDMGNYDESFKYYKRGNDLNRGRTTYDPKAIEALSERLKLFFTEDRFNKYKDFGNNSNSPIFIVGLPRSGSTLIEQILASHSKIEGTMELPNIMNIARKLGNSTKDRTAYPEVIDSLLGSDLTDLGKSFIDETQFLRTGKQHFIDKMPNNFSHIGLIKLILPNAKIIDARRNPMDTCFSCFKQLFARGQAFTYDLSEIARYYVNYINLMDHWDKVLPGYVFKVQHEDLLNNQEGVTRDLIEFCEVDFESSTLEFYKTKRAVKTASSEQVREPINTKGLNQWKNYEIHLKDLKFHLESIITSS